MRQTTKKNWAGVLLEVRKKGGTRRVMNALKDKRYGRKIG